MPRLRCLVGEKSNDIVSVITVTRHKIGDYFCI